MKAPAPAITAWDQLPLMVTIDQVAALYGRQPSAIERLVRLGRKSIPMPVLMRPMRWSRADLQRHLESPAPSAAIRRRA